MIIAMTNIVSRLTTLDYSIVIAYLLILMIIGYYASFGSKKKNGETLFLANKSLGWTSIGYSTGIVAVNFECYAFVFLMLLALVFAPRYIAAKVSTMPEFMGNRY